MNIEFIIPTYQRPHHLMAMLSSLCSQTRICWRAHVIADAPTGEDLEKLKKIIEYHKDDDRIRFTILPERHNDFGHTPRNYGLDHAQEEFIVMTGEDNYYMPTFVANFIDQAYDDNIHFYYCNMVHNWVDGTYPPIKTRIDQGMIDIGCYMFRRKHMGDIRLNPDYAESDYYFIQDYLNAIKSFSQDVVKIDKILYVHN